jgi:hypothetical protein
MKNIIVSITLLAAIATPATAQTTSPVGTSSVVAAPIQNQNGGAGNVQSPGNPYAPVAARTPYAIETCANQSLSGTSTGTVGSAGNAAAAAPPGCN